MIDDLLLELRNLLLQITEDKETAVLGPCGLLHVVAVVSANDHSMIN